MKFSIKEKPSNYIAGGLLLIILGNQIKSYFPTGTETYSVAGYFFGFILSVIGDVSFVFGLIYLAVRLFKKKRE